MSTEYQSKCHNCGEFEDDCVCDYCNKCGKLLESETCDCKDDMEKEN